MLLTSCTSDEDYRDVLVGEYNGSATGYMSLMYNGDVAGTVPMDVTEDATVTKVGVDEISISGIVCTVSEQGGKLIFDTETQTKNEDGATIQLTIIRTGSYSGTTLTIKETYSGTWQANSISGIVSGTANYVFTKK